MSWRDISSHHFPPLSSRVLPSIIVHPHISLSTLRFQLGGNPEWGLPQYISTVEGPLDPAQHASAHRDLINHIGLRTYLNYAHLNYARHRPARLSRATISRSAKTALHSLDLAGQMSSMMPVVSSNAPFSTEGYIPRATTASAEIFIPKYRNDPGDGPVPLPKCAEVCWKYDPDRNWEIDRWQMTFPDTGWAYPKSQTFWSGYGSQIKMRREGIPYTDGDQEPVTFTLDAEVQSVSDAQNRTITLQISDDGTASMILHTFDQGDLAQQEAHHQQLLQTLRKRGELQLEAITISFDRDSVDMRDRSTGSEASPEYLSFSAPGTRHIQRLDGRFFIGEDRSEEMSGRVMIPNPAFGTWNPSVSGTL